MLMFMSVAKRALSTEFVTFKVRPISEASPQSKAVAMKVGGIAHIIVFELCSNVLLQNHCVLWEIGPRHQHQLLVEWWLMHLVFV